MNCPLLLLWDGCCCILCYCCFFPAAAAADDDGKDSDKDNGKDAADSDAIIVIASDRDNGMGWDGMGCDAIGWKEGEERCKIKHTPQKRKNHHFNCFERNFASH